jgi:hypothetical protein
MVTGALASVLAETLLRATPPRASGALTLPTGAMILHRRLERGMADNATIAVEREWTVRFDRQGSGAAIAGAQLTVRVDAPPVLSKLAQIEADRSTDAMFPILLADSGAILAAGDFILGSDVDRAMAEAGQIIAERPIPAEVKDEQLYYLAILQRSAGKVLDQLPADLFFPVTSPARITGTIPLPDGTKGEFEATYAANFAPDGAWLDRAEREVISRIGASERRSREVWSLRRA